MSSTMYFAHVVHFVAADGLETLSTMITAGTVLTKLGYSISVKKIRKNIHSSDIQVTFELYGYFRCLQVICSKENYIC